MKCRLRLQLDSKLLIPFYRTRFSAAPETKEGDNKWPNLHQDKASDARTAFTKL